jgi:hypothetical protein
MQDVAVYALLYSLPIAIFPYFSLETGYPQEEESNWWVYLILCVLEVLCYQIRVIGGLRKVLRRINILLRRVCNNN